MVRGFMPFGYTKNDLGLTEIRDLVQVWIEWGWKLDQIKATCKDLGIWEEARPFVLELYPHFYQVRLRV